MRPMMNHLLIKTLILIRIPYNAKNWNKSTMSLLTVEHIVISCVDFDISRHNQLLASKIYSIMYP